MRDRIIAALDRKLHDYTSQEKLKIDQRVLDLKTQAEKDLELKTKIKFDDAIKQVFMDNFLFFASCLHLQ